MQASVAERASWGMLGLGLEGFLGGRGTSAEPRSTERLLEGSWVAVQDL